VAIYPGAVVKLIPRHNRPLNPSQLILHTAVSGTSSLYGYFSRADTDVCSHFYVREDGTVEQYVDTRFQAPANRNANASAISVETWDDGRPNTTPWTARQVIALVALALWCHHVHGVPLRLCASPTSPGVGWHSQWGAPSAWTPAAGKTCPGPARIPQVAAIVAAAASPEEELPVDVPNPYSGQNEPAAVAIGYAEKRIREGVLADLRAALPGLIAEAVMNAEVTSAVDGKTKAPLRQFIAWIDRATNALAKKEGL